jgi:hypothetical protein
MEILIDYQELLTLLRPFYNFYDYSEITEYYLKKKYERVHEQEFRDISQDIFNDPTINPMDMEFELVEISGSDFLTYTTQIASFPIESQIGRRITFGLREKNSNKYVGFTRIASPVSSIKPRNDFFGESLKLNVVNNHIYNGQTIVPVQPFGFNYLGGKLMSLICISNEVKNMFNERYNTDISVFETTSLYGNSKSNSMYDGLEPYIKYKGMTESSNYLFPTDEVYVPLRNLCRRYYGLVEEGNSLVTKKGSSPKMREFTKVLQIVKEHLKHYDTEEFNKFVVFLNTKCKSLQQKRFYTSNFGITNVKEFMLNGETKNVPNPDKYDLSNLIDYWKRKSYNRWTKLTEEGRLRTQPELYTRETLTNGIHFNLIR